MSNTVPIVVNTFTSGDQSPPKVVVLDDGRVLYVWTDYASTDGSLSACVNGRILNPDGTPATDTFAIGTLLIDGYDHYDVDNLDVTTLADGNVVVGYVRSTAEAGYDTPVMSIIDPTFAPTDPNFTVATDVVMVQNDTTTYETPPVLLPMDDGRFMTLWGNDGIYDNHQAMTLQARIYNPDGTPATDQFQVGDMAYDGADGYDVPNFSMIELTSGLIVVSQVRSSIETGDDEPIFTILNPAVAPTDPGFVVAQDVEMQQNDVTVYESPAQMVALDDGRFMAIWVRDGLGDNQISNTLQGRIFNPDGTPSTDEFQVGNLSVEGDDGADFDSFNITQMPDGTVVVGYAGGYAQTGYHPPLFSLIDPSLSPTYPGFAIATDVQIDADFTGANGWVAAPVIMPLGGGQNNFVAVWSNEFFGDGELMYRVFSDTGEPVTASTQITTDYTNYVDAHDGFDWDHIDVVALSGTTFQIGWVGTYDGSGTGAFSTTVEVVCFCSGTLLATMKGDCRIEELMVGDQVLTRDHGFQTVRWIGKRLMFPALLDLNPSLAPVRIAAGSLGPSHPQSDLLVSPQHRILVRSAIAERMFDQSEVLVAAKHLCGLDGITTDHDLTSFFYWHILFDDHELVLSNGAWTESLYVGAQSTRALTVAQLREILTLFPELAVVDYSQTRMGARTFINGRRGRRMTDRMIRNGKAPFDPNLGRDTLH